MSKESCKPVLLSGSNACEVWVCSCCGTITLHVGPVSLRLKPQHFNDALITMHEAAEKLQQVIAQNNAFKTAFKHANKENLN